MGRTKRCQLAGPPFVAWAPKAHLVKTRQSVGWIDSMAYRKGRASTPLSAGFRGLGYRCSPKRGSVTTPTVVLVPQGVLGWLRPKSVALLMRRALGLWSDSCRGPPSFSRSHEPSCAKRANA